MDAPDELVEAVAQAIVSAHLIDPHPDPSVDIDYERCARAVLSVPALADALYAADEGEVYVIALEMACSDGWSDGESAMQHYIEAARTRIEAAALDPLDPEAGK